MGQADIDKAVDKAVELTWVLVGMLEADSPIGLTEADRRLASASRASSSLLSSLILLPPSSSQKIKHHGDFCTPLVISPSSQPIFSLELLES